MKPLVLRSIQRCRASDTLGIARISINNIRDHTDRRLSFLSSFSIIPLSPLGDQVLDSIVTQRL